MKPDSFRTAYAERADAFQKGFGHKAESRSDALFTKYCDEITERLSVEQACLDQMFAHFDEVGFGAIFSSERNKQWALILPDASQPGKFRYQLFGIHGWISHYTCNTIDEVIFEACEAGCCIPAPASTLDDLATTKDWLWGTERLDVITRLNRGFITSKEAHECFIALEEKYSAAA